MILPLTLIFAGVLFLMRNTGLLDETSWGIIWPIVLIVLGSSILFRRGDRSCPFCIGKISKKGK